MRSSSAASCSGRLCTTFSPRYHQNSPRPDAGAHLRREAGARQLGRDEARCLTVRCLIPPLEHRAGGFHLTRLSTGGPSPWPPTMQRACALPQPPRRPPWTAGAVAGDRWARLATGEGPAPWGPLPVDPACPGADDAAPADAPCWPRACVQRGPLPPSPRRCPSREAAPGCSLAAARGTREGACSPWPVRAWRLPRRWAVGRAG
jgi:hypothetical protein